MKFLLLIALIYAQRQVIKRYGTESPEEKLTRINLISERYVIIEK